ncbi:YIEGIA family protein [Laceyella putida]|uniref:YIEGIA family protein n=1 Tax=Laceyella putida TaxID=110101 RepID=A0ABW2RMZ9_9BACL
MTVSLYTMAVILGVATGFGTRIRLLQCDYRQYPTYPHGHVIHLALGFIAAALGAVAVPALAQKDYTAVTFLTLAAQQFRDVRNMERQMLSNLDEMELVPRGKNYIEGIAMVFEGRNYIVIFAAFLTSLSVMLYHYWWVGAITGVLTILLSGFLMSGKVIHDIADVEVAELRNEGPSLYVDDIYLMNIGLEDNRKRILENGIGIVITPRQASARITIGNVGQRQAILHDVSSILGVYRDTGEPALVPLAKRDLKDGRLGVLLLPQEKDVERAMAIVKNVPVLESAIRKPGKMPHELDKRWGNA